MLLPYKFFGRSRACVLGPFLNRTRSLLSSSIFLQISEALRSKNIFCYLCFTDGIIWGGVEQATRFLGCAVSEGERVEPSIQDVSEHI